jgi:hypothetical protein
MVPLTYQGDLDGTNDKLKPRAYQTCNIDQAERINKYLYIESASNSNDEAKVTDEKGDLYRLEFADDCNGIFSYPGKTLYLMMNGGDMMPGDKLFLPRGGAVCTLRTVTSVRETGPSNTVKTVVEVRDEAKEAYMPKTDDTHVPGTVVRVRAFANKNKVYLFWNRATDDKGIDHYVVGYHTSRIDPQHIRIQDMPNQFNVVAAKAVITDLLPDQDYYFYVLAVDAAGNTSSYWSQPGFARTLSSIAPLPTESSGNLDMKLRILKETESTFLIKWNPPAGTFRTNIFLDVDGTREISLTEYAGTNYRLIKRPDRKGKDLKFTVELYDQRGLLLKDNMKLGF